MPTLDLDQGQSHCFSTVVDPNLDNAFGFGVRNSALQEIAGLLAGYTGFSTDLKKLVKSTFLEIFASMLKGTDYVAPSFSGTWTDFGDASFPVLGYRKDGMNMVMLRGRARSNGNNIGNSIFTLPSAYRPSKNKIFACIADNVICSIQIGSDGTVTPLAGPTSDTWFSLEGIIFNAEQ